MGRFRPSHFITERVLSMAKSNKKPLTNKERLEREYNKQIRRIERRRKEMEQLGYVSDDVKTPKKPNRVTEGSIRRLKKITPKFIREHSRIVSFESGEFANPNTKASERIAKENAILASETVTIKKAPSTVNSKTKTRSKNAPNMDERIISNFLNLMSQLPIPVYDIIKKTVYRHIAKVGKGQVAEALHTMPEDAQNGLLACTRPSDIGIIEFDTYLYNYMSLSDDEKEVINETLESESWDDSI